MCCKGERSLIHPTAIIDPKAELAPNVKVGAYSIIEADVSIGADTEIGPHVVIRSGTRIGVENHIFQFCSIGEIPQDKKYRGEDTRLEIGDRNTIREFCSFNKGTVQGGGITKIGSDNWIMAYCHIAHDCLVGNQIVFANNASLAGHVEIHDKAILGGFTIVHQFCRIGTLSLLAMGAGINHDVPPFVIVSGHLAEPRSINAEGLRRANFSKEAIEAVWKAYKILYRRNLRIEDAKVELEKLAKLHSEVQPMVDFLAKSDRGIAR